MPRLARLDITGLLQHVIVRGIERRDIFNDDHGRQKDHGLPPRRRCQENSNRPSTVYGNRSRQRVEAGGMIFSLTATFLMAEWDL